MKLGKIRSRTLLVLSAALAVAVAQALQVRAMVRDIHTIKHVIIIMQENRSFDQYFGTFPGAAGIPMKEGVPTVCVNDPNTGRCVAPYHNPNDVNYGGPHTATDALRDVNAGKMDGFIQSVRLVDCKGPNPQGCMPGNGEPDVMGYHDAREIPNYWTYAKTFVLQDHLFEPTISWSLPSHLFMVSGWAAHCLQVGDPLSCENDFNGLGDLDVAQNNYAWTDLTYLLHKAKISWAYYLSEGVQPDCANDEMACPPKFQDLKVPSIWNPLPEFTTVKQNNELGNIQGLGKYFDAVKAGTLPAVAWIIPEGSISEHPTASIHNGEKYVTSLINAAMQGPDWSSTAIFLAWDDWGGFYDHMSPPNIDKNGYGLRVPGLVISPYAKTGYIDHQILSFDAYLKFIEDDFLNGQRLDPATDGRPDPRPTVRENVPQLGDLVNDFDFTQSAHSPLLLPVLQSNSMEKGLPYTTPVIP